MRHFALTRGSPKVVARLAEGLLAFLGRGGGKRSGQVAALLALFMRRALAGLLACGLLLGVGLFVLTLRCDRELGVEEDSSSPDAKASFGRCAKHMLGKLPWVGGLVGGPSDDAGTGPEAPQDGGEAASRPRPWKPARAAP